MDIYLTLTMLIANKQTQCGSDRVKYQYKIISGIQEVKSLPARVSEKKC